MELFFVKHDAYALTIECVRPIGAEKRDAMTRNGILSPEKMPHSNSFERWQARLARFSNVG